MATRRSSGGGNTYRFFVDPGAINGHELLVENRELAHQLGSVLRLRPGDEVTILDGSGYEYRVTLNQLTREVVAGTISEQQLARSEPRLQITLYVALLRGERFEWVLQKGTELGVIAFVPLICERSLVELGENRPRKAERWQRIVQEAAEQACRARLPSIAAPLAFESACVQLTMHHRGLLLWEGEDAPALRSVLRSSGIGQPGTDTDVALLSGPEGGFSPVEIELARRYQVQLVSLGPRILRAETAPLAAVSALLYEAGDLE